MAYLVIYGASDDLIEFEGVVRDELPAPFGERARVVVKVDGAKWATIPIEYDDSGEWRIEHEEIDQPYIFSAARGDGEPDDEHGCPGYSDKVVIDMGDVSACQITYKVKAVD
jgi:hypothetical protein